MKSNVAKSEAGQTPYPILAAEPKMPMGKAGGNLMGQKKKVCSIE